MKGLLEEVIKVVKERFPWGFEEYQESCRVEVPTGAFSWINILFKDNSLSEEKFWEEFTKILAKEWEPFPDCDEYTDEELREDNRVCEELQKIKSIIPLIDYKIETWSCLL